MPGVKLTRRPYFLKRELQRRCAQLLLMLDDPEIGLVEIAEWAQQQKMLGAALLGVANSPTHHLRCEVREVRHAVAMLGLTRLREFAEKTAADRAETVSTAAFEE